MTHTIQFLAKETVQKSLQEAAKQCESLIGTVAFWTIGFEQIEQFLSMAFLDKLAYADSYMCVDISTPTDLDKLNSLVKDYKSTIYLHCVEFYPKDAQSKEFQRLLHSKILLFKLPNGQAKIWLGSHNFTQFALSGLNFESSVLIETEQNSELYQNVEEYIENVKRSLGVVKFEPQDLDIYKALQKQIEEVFETIVLEKPISFEKGEEILLLLKDSELGEAYKKYGNKTNLDIQWPEKREFYRAKIIGTEQITDLQNSSYQDLLAFEIDRYFSVIPYPEKRFVNQDFLKNFSYCIRFQIEKKLEEVEIRKVFYEPLTDLWLIYKKEKNNTIGLWDTETENYIVHDFVKSFLSQNFASSVKIFNQFNIELFRQNIRKKAVFYRLTKNQIEQMINYYRYQLAQMGFRSSVMDRFEKSFSNLSNDLKRNGLVKKRKVIKDEKQNMLFPISTTTK
jgi:NgoFVII restriction endonuclease